MRRFIRLATCVCAAAANLWTTDAYGQGRPVTLASTRADAASLRAADGQIDQMLRSGELRVREAVADSLIPSRRHERLDQYVRGVRIVGGDVTRQIAPDGTVSVFGVLHSDVAIGTTPALSADDARRAIGAAVSGEPTGEGPELVVLPLSDGYHLAYAGRALVDVEIVNVFIDANSGALLRQYSDFARDGLVGSGLGVYGDRKKIDVKQSGGAYVADDGLRPAAITTYDMRGNLSHLLGILNGITPVVASDIASSTSTTWSDSTVVDAHAYVGWYYDYLYRRFNRSGLNGANLRMPVFTHPVNAEDIRTASTSVIGLYYLNAFSCGTCGPDGRGAIVLGSGAPNGSYLRGIDVKPFGSALDVVAHELTHQVTSNTARLNGFPFSEAGALNEAFSDMFGLSTAFFFEPAGSAPLNASYLIGRDLTVPAGVLSRSIASPHTYGDPDHYTQRFVGGDPHSNSTIASHAFYLAIEGGRNATSGLTVQGVGSANREQIEKTFFRALTSLMPSSSTFALTRQATIQSARDLYGAGGTVERAVTQAWDAVGVQPRTAPTATALPNPAVTSASTVASCGASPAWVLGVTVSAGSSNLRITGFSSDDFNDAGTPIDHSTYSAASFAASFNSCGPGSTTILAQADACSAVCWQLNPGVTSGSTQINFTAVDDAGRTVTFSTPRVTLK